METSVVHSYNARFFTSSNLYRKASSLKLQKKMHCQKLVPNYGIKKKRKKGASSYNIVSYFEGLGTIQPLFGYDEPAAVK